VYRAPDLSGGGQLAVKVPHHVLVEDKLVAERFRREASSVEQLHDPNIVRVFDNGVCDGMH
jgi:serine/threonine protein kinase